MSARPFVGDAVVSDGVKYRVLAVTPHAAHLTKSGPHWRSGQVERLADPSRLSWDHTAGVWRGPTVEAPW